MTEEKRLVTSQDIQMVASAVLKQRNEAGDRLVGAKVKEGRDDFYEILLKQYNLKDAWIENVMGGVIPEKGESKMVDELG